jgi:hypothetical protein
MAGGLSRVNAFEIRVIADGGHRRQNLGERAPAGTRERRPQDCAVFRFGASAMGARALLKSPDEFVIHSTHEQIRHILGSSWFDSNDIIPPTGRQGGYRSAQ